VPDGGQGTGAVDPALRERFDALVAAFAGRPGVTLPGQGGGRGFGADALRVSGAIFAMRSRGCLVLKLPRDRVAALVAAGTGLPFDAGKGTPMGEWVAVADGDDAAWLSLAEEAFAFVGGRAARR
jgi:hypothetical protein